ncbi:hypothetical protein ACFFX0_16675 [Citricoccus parietis]|uniref:Uncharacterized protein n=1 Tax=Citricoccus parietis TaxID=592307 RepID=A0ABV5G1D2_9MICC
MPRWSPTTRNCRGRSTRTRPATSSASWRRRTDAVGSGIPVPAGDVLRFRPAAEGLGLRPSLRRVLPGL